MPTAGAFNIFPLARNRNTKRKRDIFVFLVSSCEPNSPLELDPKSIAAPSKWTSRTLRFYEARRLLRLTRH